MAPHASKPAAWRGALHVRVLQQLWKQGTRAAGAAGVGRAGPCR